MSAATTSGRAGDVVVRPLLEQDLDQADRICRVAFGTFVGAPAPETFFGDADYVKTRWRADPAAALGAEIDGTLVGSNFATNWGSVGFFGPLSVQPDHWDRGIARRLLGPTMDLFASWGTPHVGLYTFAQSPKHVGLYQGFGFWPRYLTAVMDARVTPPERGVDSVRFSEAASRDRTGTTAAIRELTATVLDGLDVTHEIDAVFDQSLGETVLIDDESGLQGVAVCHIGPGTEAGGDHCYVKFAAVRPGPNAATSFERLLDACHDLATTVGVSVLTAGVSFGREKAYGALLARGFRTGFQGVRMHRPNELGYDRPDSYVLDDWR